MPSGYVIANVEITDRKLYDTYASMAIASVENKGTVRGAWGPISAIGWK